jgi:hypothetical protein
VPSVPPGDGTQNRIAKARAGRATLSLYTVA